MAHPYHHARSTARRFGGAPGDYLHFHEFMDHTKAHLDGNPIVELLPDKEQWTGQRLYGAKGTYGWKEIWEFSY